MLGLAAVPASAQDPPDDDIRASIAKDMPALMDVYRDLHQHPELSFQEVQTAAKLAKRARDLGFEVTEGVGRTGVVAVMRNGAGPTVMLRADMDALPVAEQTGLPFASKAVATTDKGIESPVMHACGHDTHMTAWLATAKQLASRKADWSGTLVMVLQPAEETGAGAVAMLEDGLFERFPKPEVVLAFHDAAQMPAGLVGVRPGYALANVDSVGILVHGVGGHGAYPHTAKDPVVLGARIVGALQTLVSREIDPQEPAVVTVGSFRAGSKHNIISDRAELLITVRSYTDETREKLIEGIKRIARGEAIAAGIPDDLMPEVTLDDVFTPATYNTPELTKDMQALFVGRFGEKGVIETPAVMGGEDFSRFRREDPEHVKSLIFWVGGTPAAEIEKVGGDLSRLPSLHSPFWAPDAEKVIPTAAEALTAATLDLMAKR